MMTTTENKQRSPRLQQFFDGLQDLNPHTAEIARPALLTAADETSPDAFAQFAQKMDELIIRYRNSHVKRAESTALDTYFQHIDRANRQLSETGELSQQFSADTSAQPQQFAMTKVYRFTPADWFKIQEHARVPAEVQHSVDAAVARNDLIATVLSVAFEALHRIDSDAAFQWELEYLERTQGDLDVDVVRDLLRVWRRFAPVPRAVIMWARQWSHDENLRRLWPALVRDADRLLRQQALRAWLKQTQTRQTTAMHLQMLLNKENVQEKRLTRWFDAATDDMGTRIDVFIHFAGKSRENHDATTYRDGMVAELQALEALVVPLLISADLALHQPAGTYGLALNFLGFSRAKLTRWRRTLEDKATSVVRTIFLSDLKNAVAPVDRIRQLCLGDRLLFNRLCLRLDILTKQFDSLEEREHVVDVLATNYASFRESDLIGRELTQRYRRLMRMLHSDNLQRLLTAAQYELIEDNTVLRELSTLAAAARHFLNQRRHMQASLQEMYTSDIEFCDAVRNSRLHVISSILEKQSRIP